MTYTSLAMTAVLAGIVVDLLILRIALVRRGAFWTTYAIVLFFQLVTNGWLTGRGIVRYDPAAALTGGGPARFLGDWRVAFAPVEDLLFGFAMVLLTLDLWVFWGRRDARRIGQRRSVDG